MSTKSADSIANQIIAYINYWGDKDFQLRIPAIRSISINLDNLFTLTRVSFDPAFTFDELCLDGEIVGGEPHEQVSKFLNYVRRFDPDSQS